MKAEIWGKVPIKRRYPNSTAVVPRVDVSLQTDDRSTGDVETHAITVDLHRPDGRRARFHLRLYLGSQGRAKAALTATTPEGPQEPTKTVTGFWGKEITPAQFRGTASEIEIGPKPGASTGDSIYGARLALRHRDINPSDHYRIPAMMIADLIRRGRQHGVWDLLEGLESIYGMITIETDDRQRAQHQAGA